MFSPNSVGITEAERSVIDPVELPELKNPGCVDTAIYLYPSAPVHVAWEQNLYPDCADIEPADRNRRSYVWRRSQGGTFEPLVRRDRWAGVSLWRTGEVEWNLERALDGYKESVRWESAECGHEVVKLDRAYRWSVRTRDGTTVKLDTVHNSDSVEGPCNKKPFAK